VTDTQPAPGLPTDAQLRSYRIWDSYFTPAHSYPGKDGTSKLFEQITRALPAASKASFERLCYFPHVGTGTTSDPTLERLLRSDDKIVLRPLQRWPKLLMGMIQLNANNLQASLDALNRWLRDGPMVGVYFPGGGPGALTCTHRNFSPLIERIHKLKGLIMQHTWFKTGGKTGRGESTPNDLATIAARFPEQTFLCAHAGGEWQTGIRAIRRHKNILIETSGFDASAGFIDMALREIGAKRIVFGSHLPSRSLGTELAKIIGSKATEDERRLILGANFRRLLDQAGPG